MPASLGAPKPDAPPRFDVESAVADASRFDVYKLVDAAVGGDAARAVRILSGIRTEGIEPVIVMWALTRELRTLARLADSVQSGLDLSSGFRKVGVWQSRQGLVRACIGRHQAADFYRLIQLARDADAAAKGQLRADPWQLARQIVLTLAKGCVYPPGRDRQLEPPLRRYAEGELM